MVLENLHTLARPVRGDVANPDDVDAEDVIDLLLAIAPEVPALKEMAVGW